MANTLAYYDTATKTAVKSFIVHNPGKKISDLAATSIIKDMLTGRDLVSK